MADFETPFASEAETRLPTQSEKENGFPCGPADQRLFNGMFHRIEAEIGEVIDHAGIAFTDDRNTLLREAIQALIDAVTGEAETDSYLLLSQAQARLPIFPIIETATGKIDVISPATGSVRIPGGVGFLHRGIVPLTTVETDFVTDISKIYHIRWHSVDGYVLRDLASLTYNPSSLDESNEFFDSTYDDMLIARVITNSSNVATITNLINLQDIKASGEITGPRGSLSDYVAYEDNVTNANITEFDAITVDMARTPESYLKGFTDLWDHTYLPGSQVVEYNVGVKTLSRYQIAAYAHGDTDVNLAWSARA